MMIDDWKIGDYRDCNNKEILYHSFVNVDVQKDKHKKFQKPSITPRNDFSLALIPVIVY